MLQYVRLELVQVSGTVPALRQVDVQAEASLALQARPLVRQRERGTLGQTTMRYRKAEEMETIRKKSHEQCGLRVT